MIYTDNIILVIQKNLKCKLFTEILISVMYVPNVLLKGGLQNAQFLLEIMIQILNSYYV
jgi:hypothetical protein